MNMAAKVDVDGLVVRLAWAVSAGRLTADDACAQLVAAAGWDDGVSLCGRTFQLALALLRARHDNHALIELGWYLDRG
jgi:hypothetical protein